MDNYKDIKIIFYLQKIKHSQEYGKKLILNDPIRFASLESTCIPF